MTEKSDHVRFRLPAATKAAAIAAATKDGHTLSSWLKKLVVAALSKGKTK